MTRRLVGWAALALAAAAMAGAWGAAGERPARAERWSPKALTKRFPDPDAGTADDQWVGSLDCRECHEDRWTSLRTSFHAKLLAAKSASHGCEACHGPGWDHYETGGDGPIRHPGKAGATEVDGMCLRCHQGVLSGPIDGHRDWVFPRGAEKGEPRACVDCHRVHVDRKAPEFSGKIGPFATPAAAAKVAKDVPARTCIDCHAE